MNAESRQSKGRKVAVAMSGGVDSTVTAALLKEAGAEVRGVFMCLGQPGQEAQVEQVGALAARLGIPLEVIDLRTEFAARVVDYFRASYFRGETPNPCVVCNREIKLGLLLEKVLADGSEFLATGHYVRLHRDPDGGCHLLRGLDPGKDQSYFLCGLSQAQLRRLLFPLGEHRKSEVYELAAGLGLHFTPGQESQDVCFLKGRELADFLAAAAPPDSAGPVVTTAGREIGRHAGIYHFTIGQRRGLRIPAAAPYYVVGLEAAGSRVVVGSSEELFRDRLWVPEVNWLAGVPELPDELAVQIRYRQRPVPARLSWSGSSGVEVHFTAPQRAVTPGQFAAFYRGEELLGGGVIRLSPEFSAVD
ncbi:MAG TPA: tRNA 2-thiouridine(34) synthase MnmA [Desulfurivibrionaceae bacterium]|nr:tRNA 2-thiouridine(34) synthase MnmA [Desulfurivibrionaceae bacterium]